MPPAAAALAAFNPLVIAHTVLREILLFGVPFNLMIKDIALLFGYAIVFAFILYYVSKRRNKERF
jgi:ABC-type polysaccharide/polyol phosphate export permease